MDNKIKKQQMSSYSTSLALAHIKQNFPLLVVFFLHPFTNYELCVN